MSYFYSILAVSLIVLSVLILFLAYRAIIPQVRVGQIWKDSAGNELMIRSVHGGRVVGLHNGVDVVEMSAQKVATYLVLDEE